MKNSVLSDLFFCLRFVVNGFVFVFRYKSRLFLETPILKNGDITWTIIKQNKDGAKRWRMLAEESYGIKKIDVIIRWNRRFGYVVLVKIKHDYFYPSEPL